MGLWKKMKTDATIAMHALMRGLSSANDKIVGPQMRDGGEIRKENEGSGVFKDMLEQKVTQEVEEMRDKYYRILKEADQYNVSVKLIGDVESNDYEMVVEAKKKDKSDFMPHCEVYNPENLKIRTIQDNKTIPEGIDGYVNTIELERDGFSPRIPIEKYVTKIVSMNIPDTDSAYVHLYLPTMASQFGKIDAILISFLNAIWIDPKSNTDITEVNRIKWASDRGWNSNDGCIFEYSKPKFLGIDVFDGNFILKYECHIEQDGKYVGDKYKTETLTKKYEEHSVTDYGNKSGVDLMAAERKIIKDEIINDNLSITTLKLS